MRRLLRPILRPLHPASIVGRVLTAVLLTHVVPPVAVAAAASSAPATSTSAPAEAEERQPVQQLQAFEVSASRVHASEVEGPQPIDRYDPTQIEESGAFTVDEFLDTLPPGDDDEEQLVLIDGVPAYLDPSLLALGMIEGIDVALEGSMPEHGARADGRVINIRLKKDFVGGEIGVRTSHTFAGGGRREEGKFGAAIARGRYRLMFSLTHDRAQGLRATERSFSANQDHRARGGRDLRLTWGYPAVVAAVDGELDSFADSGLDPVAAVLLPEGALSPPVGDAFIPADPAIGPGAEGQRRFDTAAYRWLSAPSERTGGALQFHVTLTPRLNLTLSASHRDTRTEREDAPPVTAASPEFIIPAAYNPFGEDVELGLVHVGFGPTRQQSRARRSELGLNLHGRFAESWKWNGGLGYRRDLAHDVASDLDESRFAAALREDDPSRRFNPFVDERVAPTNVHLYPALTAERTRERMAEDRRLDLGASGDVFDARGGEARLSLRGRYGEREWERQASGLPAEAGSESEQRSSYAGTAALTVPWVGAANARPAVRRLESELAASYEEQSDGGRERETELGLVWSPVTWLLLRAEVEAEAERPPTLIETRADSLTGATLIDPRRDFAVVTDVREIVRDVIHVEPETSDEFSVGATIEPSFLEGLRFKVDYDDRRRRRLFQDEFEAQEVLYNEAAFPERVVRGEPTAEDLAAGRPGPVIEVNTTGGNAGEASSRDIDLSLDYRTQGTRWGRFRVSAHARHLLDARYEIVPGVVFVNEGGSRFNPPAWRFRGTASWTWEGWTVSLRADHTGEITTGIVDDDLPAYTEYDLNLGYRWQRPLWGRFGRVLRIMVSLDNLLDRDPPLADTLSGYRGGSPLGRSIQIAATLPLGSGGRSNGGGPE